jgi:hypothetical protein
MHKVLTKPPNQFIPSFISLYNELTPAAPVTWKAHPIRARITLPAMPIPPLTALLADTTMPGTIVLNPIALTETVPVPSHPCLTPLLTNPMPRQLPHKLLTSSHAHELNSQILYHIIRIGLNHHVEQTLRVSGEASVHAIFGVVFSEEMFEEFGVDVARALALAGGAAAETEFHAGALGEFAAFLAFTVEVCGGCHFPGSL